MTAKEQARIMIDKLPDDATMDDIMFILYEVKKSNSSVTELKNEVSILKERAKMRVSQWLEIFEAQDQLQNQT